MTDRPPDWHRRLRELERRADVRDTDIIRLWNWMPQATEMTGLQTPMIPPVTTTPAPTTTTTSTSTTSTSTTSTSTTSTSTTPIPATCKNKWPWHAAIEPSGFTGEYHWMNVNPGYVGMNGYHALQYYICGYSPNGTFGPNVYHVYRGSQFTVPGLTLTVRWELRVTLSASETLELLPNWQYGSGTEFDHLNLDLRLYGTFSSVDYRYNGAISPPYSSPLPLTGNTYSLPVVAVYGNDDYYSWPSTIPLTFSSSAW